MPITLGCPSCGKRFRARDESAGKKVKCPYCQAAVAVPTAEEAANAAASTPPDSDAFPPQAPRPAPLPRPTSPPPVVASPADWGAVPTAPVPTAPPRRTPAPESEPEPFPPMSPPSRGDKPRPKPAKAEKPEPEPKAKKPKKADETPEETLAKCWRAVRRGLFWVQFALLWLSLLGFIGFGKAVYARAVEPLPKGDGWIKIDGWVNTPDQNAIQLSKTDEINLLAFGLPVCLAGVALTLGRLTAGGAPRNSGAGGLFALSGLLTLVAFIALLAFKVCERMLFREEERYAYLTFLLVAPLAEFWFLVAITASGLALKRPKVARAVGLLGFVAALIPALVTVGWEQYVQHGRPRKPDADWLMYEQAGLMIGWLILIGTYWRAVRGVRVAAKEFIVAVEDKE